MAYSESIFMVIIYRYSTFSIHWTPSCHIVYIYNNLSLNAFKDVAAVV